MALGEAPSAGQFSRMPQGVTSAISAVQLLMGMFRCSDVNLKLLFFLKPCKTPKAEYGSLQ